MDILKPLKFTAERLTVGGWAYLADVAMSTTVEVSPPPLYPPPPNGSNSWIRPKDPDHMEQGWESYDVREAA